MPCRGPESPATPDLAYLLGAPSRRFVAGEDIVLELALINLGTTPIELPDPESTSNWQPPFSVTGPGPDDAFTFDRLGLARGRPSRPLPDSAAVLVAIP